MQLNQFIEELKSKGIILNDDQLDQFELYYELLIKWNAKMNLTAITERNEVYLKHFYDSISPSFHYDFKQPISLCDVGAGAGFPSIPLKICFPNLKITIVDSLNKRVGFLEHLIQQLDLQDVNVFHSRAEDFGQNNKFRESFDIVIARAVARTSVLSELCLPLCKKGGVFLAMKGTDIGEEINDAQRSIALLGGQVADQITLQLPVEQSDRSIIIINKVKNTPKKYPRKAGTPQRKPIS